MTLTLHKSQVHSSGVLQWWACSSLMSMVVRRGRQNGHLPPLEIETKKQKFVENLKSAVQLRLVRLILAMTVWLPIWHSHCTRLRFAIPVTCSDALALHLIRFFACRGRLRNWGANCSTICLCCVTVTWQQIFEVALEVTVVGVLSHVQ